MSPYLFAFTLLHSLFNWAEIERDTIWELWMRITYCLLMIYACLFANQWFSTSPEYMLKIETALSTAKHEIIFNCNNTIAIAFPTKWYKQPVAQDVSLKSVHITFTEQPWCTRTSCLTV